MLGAIMGDIVGSPYEFDHNNYKHKDFPLFSEGAQFTDDTVMTVAVAKGLIEGKGDPDRTFEEVRREMRYWGNAYPHAGYGGMFRRWLRVRDPQSYNSFGNGSAMRVAAAGWLFDTLEKTLEMAKVTAEVTHNHPEGIKGAQAAAAAIFLARTGHSKPEIRQYVEQTFGYDLSRSCDEIRPGYHHVETCQETVPEAITAFLESTGFEDALRNAVSLGGDSDTLACITGGIAEAFLRDAGGAEAGDLEPSARGSAGHLRAVFGRSMGKGRRPAGLKTGIQAGCRTEHGAAAFVLHR